MKLKTHVISILKFLMTYMSEQLVHPLIVEDSVSPGWTQRSHELFPILIGQFVVTRRLNFTMICIFLI